MAQRNTHLEDIADTNYTSLETEQVGALGGVHRVW